jgi:hypothetical protein
MVPAGTGSGRKLQLNSLTGLNSATCALSRMKKTCSYVYTLPDGVRDVLDWLETVAALKKLRSAVIGQIGSFPPRILRFRRKRNTPSGKVRGQSRFGRFV